MAELPDHVAFVTGAGRGIGQATALLLARRGATVGICDRDGASVSAAVAEIRAQGGSAHGYVVDVGERQAMLDAVGKFAHEYGRLDSLIASAMWIRYEPIEDVRDEVVDRMFAVGMKAVLWAAQAARLAMQSDRGGALVTFASPVADRGHRGTAVYTAVKGAVAALTRQLAMAGDCRRGRLGSASSGDAAWKVGPAVRHRRSRCLSRFSSSLFRHRRNSPRRWRPDRRRFLIGK